MIPSSVGLALERPAANIALLKLTSPRRLNAMDEALASAFSDAVASLRADPNVTCVILTGEGRAFSAGGSLEMLSSFVGQDGAHMRTRMRTFYEHFLSIRTLEVPTIAAVNGVAIGAGACLAAACDLRVMGASAALGFGFVRLGIGVGMGATYLLPRLVGPARAAEILYGGLTVGAQDALAWGLVNRVVSDGAVLETALGIAQTFVAGSAPTLRLIKAALVAGEGDTLERCLERESTLQAVSFGLHDCAEGIAAAIERRVPRFTHR